MSIDGYTSASLVRPLVVSDVVVPMSSSSASDIALVPAGEVARRFGARIHLLAVGIDRGETEVIAERLAGLAHRSEATVTTRLDWDVAGSTLAFAKEHVFPVVCMATHARGRLGEIVIGSHASRLIAATSDPLLLVGPEYNRWRPLTGGPVYACVDGSTVSEQVIPMAARWALGLGVSLRIATVVDPDPAARARPAHRSQGPKGDAEAYVDALAARWSQPGLDVSGQAITDPIGPAQGLAAQIEGVPCGLVAVTTHVRTGLRRAVFGSQAAGILRRSPVPVLVVPPELRGDPSAAG